MPARVGELMVVLRAQDFASRTLRRVGSEYAGLSRAQMIAAKRSDLVTQRMRANARLFEARKGLQPLRIIERRNDLLKREAAQTQTLTRARQNLNRIMRQTPVVSPGAVFPSAAPISQATTAWRNAGQQLDKTRHQLGKVDQAIASMGPRWQRAATSTTAFNREMRSASRRLMEAYNGLDKAQRAQLAFNQAMRAMPLQRAHELAHVMGGIGRTMQLFGAIGTAAFGLAAHEAAQFSQSVSLAATQMTRVGAGTGEAIANAAKLRKGILALADDYPFAAKEMAEATYEIFSGTNVQRIDDGMKILEATARVAVAGQVDLQTATKATIITMNTFRGAGENVGETMNRMFSIVRFGFMRFSDFAEMLPKVAAAAYGSGQSLDDVAGIMAFLTRKTGDASIAATQISRAFDVLSRKEFRTGIEALGVSIEDAGGKLLPLPEVLKKIMDRWGNELQRGGKGAERFIQIVTRASQEAGKGFLSTAEARRFFRFVFANWGEYMDLQDKVVSNNSEFQRSFETMMADPGVQWQIFIARVKALIIAIGQEAIPVFADLGRHIARLLDKWESLNEGTRGSIVRWGVLISVGTLLVGVMFSIVGAFVSVGLTMGTVLAKIIRVGAAFFGLSQLLGGKGTAGLIGRLFLMIKMLGFLAAIGTIVIGVELEQRGGAWKFIGQILQVGGAERALKKAGLFAGRGALGIAGRTPIAAALVELIFPDEPALQNTANDFLARVGQLDDHVQKTIQGRRRRRVVKQAESLFLTTAAQKDFETAKRVTLAFLKKMGISMKDTQDKTDSASQSFEEWMASLKDASLKGVLKELFGDTGTELEDFDAQMDAAKEAMSDWNKQLTEETARAREAAVDNLRNMYMEMERVNIEAMGELFQGPWLTSETFDLAKEWGIEPQVQDLIRDLKEQNQEFERWRASLDRLMKKGLPMEMINELKGMGLEGQPLINAILAGTPSDTKKIIAQWKRRNKNIKDATKMDFKDEIDRFRKAGVDMGDAIVNGFQSAAVGKWFDNWINTTFPGIIDAAVNTAITEWKKANPKPKLPTKPKTKPDVNKPDAKPTAATDSHDKVINQTNNFYSDEGRGGSKWESEQKAKKRRQANQIKNATKGALGK